MRSTLGYKDQQVQLINNFKQEQFIKPNDQEQSIYFWTKQYYYKYISVELNKHIFRHKTQAVERFIFKVILI